MQEQFYFFKIQLKLKFRELIRKELTKLHNEVTKSDTVSLRKHR